MIRYLLFSLTALCYVGLAMINVSKPVGNQQMGYSYALFFLGAAFAFSSLLLTITILVKGGFEWIAQGTGSRISLALLAWLLITITTFGCACFKWSWYGMDLYPQFMRWMAAYHGQIWIPLLWLVACFLSINSGWRSVLLAQLTTYSFWTGLGVSVLFSGGLLVGYLRDSAKQAEDKLASQIEDEKRYHQNRLNTVAAHKPEDSIYGILRYAAINQDDDVRQAALVKIKAHSDWEAQLLELLQKECSYNEVYYFLSANPVEHPEAFVQPLQQSIGWLSASIRKNITDSNNLQDWVFDGYGISHLLVALDADQFVGMDTAFYPHILQLKLALETTPPERFKGVHFTATDEVEAWLSNHKK